MEPRYNHKTVEQEISLIWEENECFLAKPDPTKKPFCIILPPPNASGKMHTGNVLMIAIEDILIRWHRMKGDCTLWIPGTDHAGFETQTTFERELKKRNKSRFDFDRATLYQQIWDFVQQNKNLIENQIKQMGASVDWSRYKFTLDDDVIETVCNTFKKMYAEGIAYRGYNIVNYSFKWGTTFSDAEIQYVQRVDPLYYIKYKLIDSNDYIVLATVRPETIPVDTHIAIHPKDKKNNKFIGKRVLNPLTGKSMEIITDSFVDPKFGTGIVKLTPAHDKNDYDVGLRHKLEIIPAINLEGKMTPLVGKYQGLTILKAREACVLDLQSAIEKVDENYTHQIPVDYRSGDYIENLVLPNWFIKVESLKKPALEAVKSAAIKIYPKWREKTYLRWVENMHDWAISRQIVWGIRIPVWYKIDEQTRTKIAATYKNSKGESVTNTISGFEDSNNVKLEDIEKGLQKIIVPENIDESKLVVSVEKPHDQNKWLPETDTFDTWFSSGQWPLTTLGYPDSPDFKYFYPTAVLETGWEIVTRWVSRMIMFGYYATGQPPFSHIYLHGIIRAADGKKMSKSLGNVINPDEYIEQYGADVLRMGLVSGTAGGKDFNFPKDKIISYRNFANKLWNIARFTRLHTQNKEIPAFHEKMLNLSTSDIKLLKSLKILIKNTDKNLENFRFSQAGEEIYQFLWHKLADVYLEESKERLKSNDIACLAVLTYVLKQALKLLHPFMPFITEKIWQMFEDKQEPILAVSAFPKA